ncbi:BN860_12882g1_1 [Zygosaccharomyces bailii CLIB 213]|uniref:BN860_12882g1_1 n=1 Tax=Zygosaccharomyces bailii (strain CLIB 213 / ATCC 58445 / CBS 680 / BCRC 21525 / NBRC 1098 / NCYC 1416 / NRRL Y-2227) TaxID=1333698 RepID=A0A8J2X5B5_ZYGB2|nr:BN860_12882g1_1 [Zygosaccharomyces bailii CLIB 213]
MAKRGKTPKDVGGEEAVEYEPPSKLLSSILSTLDMTFERDTGMLNGKYVRVVPSREILSELKILLGKLHVSLDSIAKGDQEVISRIEKLKHGTGAVKDEQENDGSQPTLPQRRKRPPLTDIGEEDEVTLAAPEIKRPRTEVEKMENDPSVKNPKSEFVVSQTLPKAAASLGLFNEEGLESTGEDFLKRKYQVASYPTNDLKEYLPGEIPDHNYSHPKTTNQIQYTTFLASVENFFRDFNDDDLKFLKSKYIIPINLDVNKTYDPEVTPYVIPKLGPLYSEVWAKADDSQNIANTSPPPVSDPSSILPKKSAAEINDSMLDTEEVSCGPLVSRLLSAILKDEVDGEDDNKVVVKEEGSQSTVPQDELESREETPMSMVHTPVSEMDEKSVRGSTTSTLPNPQLWKVNSINLDYPTFEERLKRELRYVGIYMNMPRDEGANGDDPDWLTGREDDEISAEIRELQTSLKHVRERNQKRKAALVPLVERQLSWQEYSSILEDLDKQLDQAYIKRIRVPKKRKKNHSSGSANSVNQGTASQVAQQKAANLSLKSLLDKRQRWIKKIGPLFEKPEIMKRIPKESVFKDLDQEEEEEETDVFGQNGNGKEDELTET